VSVRFDAYTATAEGAAFVPNQVICWAHRAGDTFHQGRGFHTFGERYWVQDAGGDQVMAVQFGGRQGDRVMVEVKGERTPEVVDRIRQAGSHRCTRVDSCVDFERPGAFEQLLGPVLQAKAKFDLYGERRGDWEKPELGRTMYLGANTSAVRARLYEKGKQPEFRHLERFDLARLEIQVRPQKEAKLVYAGLTPLEVWGASKWTRELAGEVLEAHLDPHPPGTVRKDSQRDRALRWMAGQYGPHLVSLAADLGGWDVLGLTLREMVGEAARQRKRIARATS
jgi:hypothetical protein